MSSTKPTKEEIAKLAAREEEEAVVDQQTITSAAVNKDRPDNVKEKGRADTGGES